MSYVSNSWRVAPRDRGLRENGGSARARYAGPVDVVILGGQNPRHLAWAGALVGALGGAGFDARALEYANWRAGGDTDVDAEIPLAARLAGAGGEYAVVAKSIGTVITALGTARGLLRPAAAVLLGFPLVVVEARQDAGLIRGALGRLPRAAVFQNELDPFGSAEEVTRFFSPADGGGPPCPAVTAVPGRADHEYADFGAIVAALRVLRG